MPIILSSNHDREDAEGQPTQWIGTDPAMITYHGLAICISITCLVERDGQAMLAGAHLIPYSKPDEVKRCLRQFARIGSNPLAVWVVGWVEKWGTGPDGSINTSGLTYDPADGGTLLAAIWKALAFRGEIKVYDLAQAQERAYGYHVIARSLGNAVTFECKCLQSQIIDMNAAQTKTIARSRVPPSGEASHGRRCVVM
ncbi:hypothetical protein [Novosphingobium soli]|uniref:Uncharacterized protein n=1 Tax=Novosphingobium soli TaxID=574956 RepID=A0ABV6CSA5_9SPHN